MIIFRYFYKEISSTFMAVITILLLIFLSQQFVRFIGAAAAGKYPGLAVLELMLLATPHVLGLLLPAALYIAILLAYGRFYVDSEMTVLAACGLSRGKLVLMTLLLAIFVSSIDAGLTLWLSPKISSYRNRIMANVAQIALIKTIAPGRFQATRDGKWVFYMEGMSRDNKRARNVFMAEQPVKSSDNPDGMWEVMHAKTGYQKVDKKTKNQFIVAKDGVRYFGNPGKSDYRIVKFKKYGVRINTEQAPGRKDQDEMTSMHLFKTAGDNVKNAAELQWRLSMPISVIILALLAVPMSRVQPRQGRYAKLFPAILIYIVYANMIIVGQDWTESGKIPVQLGLWWIHGIVFTLAMYLLFEQFKLKNKKEGIKS